MEQETSLKEWITKLAAYMLLLGTAASASALYKGGLDAVVKLHSPSNPAKAVGTILLLASIGWLIFVVKSGERKPQSARAGANHIAGASNIARMVRMLPTQIKSMKANRGALATIAGLGIVIVGSVAYLERETPAYFYADGSPYTGPIEFTSIERCDAYREKVHPEWPKNSGCVLK